MKESVPFKLPVYKDQTNSANIGKIIEVGDTVTLVIYNNKLTGPTTQDVTVTAVGNGGRTIEWNNSTTGNLLAERIERVHAKHQYTCAGAQNWEIVLTEASASSVKAKVTSMAFGVPSVVYDIGVEEAAAANGITDLFVEELVDKINSVLGNEGYAHGVVAGSAGSQTLTLTINGLTLRPGALVLAGLTAGSWAVV